MTRRTFAGLLAIWNVSSVFLVLTTYAYLSAIIFLVGVQADELMRKGSRKRRGIFSGVRAVTGG